MLSDIMQKVFNPANTYEKRWTLKEGITPHNSPLYSDPSLPNNLDGYTPKNNKLFTYPFCYLEVGDFSGRSEDYRFEYFENNHYHLRQHKKHRYLP